MAASPASSGDATALDALIIGAGFGGMYALYRLRELGLRAHVYDAGGGVGGTWWWNRYPGARVDFPGGPFYCYTFSTELAREWDWTETQPDQPAVEAYLNFVADRLDLRRDITLNTWVRSAVYDQASQRWQVHTDTGQHLTARLLVCAVGTLSAANVPDIPGLADFAGPVHHTGRWPTEPVSFAGQRVGVIGTGSSGIQAIPIIAREAAHLTVFQRTPQYSVPAGNRPLDPDLLARARANWPALREQMLVSPFGTPFAPPNRSALEDTPAQREALYEKLWQRGGLDIFFGSYRDLVTDEAANRTVADFVRAKIRAIVKDPETARKLMPDYLLGTKRQVLDDGYYETYNRPNVTLVDLREDPIERITAAGVHTRSGEHTLDMLVLATGYDAITGALTRLNPVGRGGLALKDAWAQRFGTYLGMAIPGFPNLFMIHGPESPSVLFNMPLGAELQAEWIRDCAAWMRDNHIGAIEPEPGTDRAWGEEVAAIANQTLFPRTDSWYTGANIPGKHRQFAVHLGGPMYFQRLRDVATGNFPGFLAEPARG